MEKNKKQHEWILDGIDCANCASKVERGVAKVAGVANSNVNYMTQTLSFEVTGEQEDQILSQVKQKVNKLEPAVVLKNKADGRLLNFDTLKSKNIQPEEKKNTTNGSLMGSTAPIVPTRSSEASPRWRVCPTAT